MIDFRQSKFNLLLQISVLVGKRIISGLHLQLHFDPRSQNGLADRFMDEIYCA